MRFKLSIITINYNNREGLEKTIKSVIEQTTHDFEYIIIDGGSTDGSVEVIKEYEKYIDYWVSEPDNGIYNAMNKGVRVAHGDYCQFLNSGDWLFSNFVIEKIINYLNFDIDIIIGYIHHYKKNKIFNRSYILNPINTTLNKLITTSLAHQGSFIKTKLLKKIPYDENMKSVGDWNFYIDAYLAHAKFAHLDFDIAYFEPGGTSKDGEFAIQEGEEKRRFLIHPIFYEEIANIPSEIIIQFNRIPDSLRFQKFLAILFKYIVNIYILCRNIKKENKKYINLKAPRFTKEEKNLYKIFHSF